MNREARLWSTTLAATVRFQVLLEVEELPETHPLDVSLAVKVELIAEGGVLLPQSSVFILQADEEDVPLPGVVQALERDVDGIFDGGRRLQDHLPRETGFGQPGRAIGENDQRYDQQNRRQR